MSQLPAVPTFPPSVPARKSCTNSRPSQRTMICTCFHCTSPATTAIRAWTGEVFIITTTFYSSSIINIITTITIITTIHFISTVLCLRMPFSSSSSSISSTHSSSHSVCSHSRRTALTVPIRSNRLAAARMSRTTTAGVGLRCIGHDREALAARPIRPSPIMRFRS